MIERTRPRRWRLAVLLTALVLLVVACSSNDNGQNSLQPKGKSARTIDNLFGPVFWVAVVVGVLVLGATVVFALKFRYRPGTNDSPKQIHGSTPLEIGWTIIPALILAVVAVPTIKTIFDLAREPKGHVLNVVVTGKQWWWQIEYPGAHVFTAGELHIPVGRPVRLALNSQDVIHSFWIPELAGKQDVIPGRKQKLVLRTDRPGTYLGQCAEYCGLSHANMRMRVIAQTPGEFDDWLRRQRLGPAQPYDGTVASLTGSKYQCINCHTFNKPSQATYAPNLTHLASRTTFAGGTYELNRENLTKWVMNAPSLIPMQSKDCRKGLPPTYTCVGMPSFTKNTPSGQPVMTQSDADQIVGYLLGEK
jgi:cytochrome c oxidase subunit II